jgi:hypothetical protein
VREWGGCKVCRATVGEEGAGLDGVLGLEGRGAIEMVAWLFRWVVIEYVCATA